MSYLERVFETEEEAVEISNLLTLAEAVVADLIATTGTITTLSTTALAAAVGVIASGSVNGMPVDFTVTPAAGAANVCDVVIQAVDKDGVALAGVFTLLVWLSDAATGVGLTGTSASGTVQAKSASGVDLSVFSAKKMVVVQTLATGAYTLEITATAKTAFYVCASAFDRGTPKTQVLATGDYGS